ncbi:AIPR family protein [Lactiplantibacillus dongliensis]|uniref:AIPR family protein n=1 Tax=Lactiplantibacillus dongliensis TaxID=2559919 RepID=A0ABW1R2C6_9LACO|nr:AIPR family protein [Lactiplantibacillus dongliensis]
MKELQFNIPAASIVRIKSPYVGSNNYIWHAYVNVMNMPDNIPTEVNPRKTNMNTKVATTMENGLLKNDQAFYKKNRGILLSAKTVTDNMGALQIDMGQDTDEDLSKYGILDGGHTYRAILDKRSSLDPENIQFVHLEIMTEIDDIDGMASARNSSIQVNDKAIAELAHKFEFVKNAIANEPFKDNIAYKQNESDKDIDAVDLIRLMFAMNFKKYGEDSLKQPIQAYSGKAQVLKDYLNEFDKAQKAQHPNNPYEKLALLLPDIAKLYDRIEMDMPKVYRESTAGGQFGRIKGVDTKGGFTKYSHEKLDYQISTGLIFPILGGFRALITEDGEWSVDPLKVWKNVSPKMVSNTISMSRQLGNNPQSAGKSITLWAQNYDTVETAKIKLTYTRK